MFRDFDDRTAANMEVALARACETLGHDRDTHENRKIIATAIMACAAGGATTLTDLTQAGRQAVSQLNQDRT